MSGTKTALLDAITDNPHTYAHKRYGRDSARTTKSAKPGMLECVWTTMQAPLATAALLNLLSNQQPAGHGMAHFRHIDI